jgi:hypothetical protein
MSKKLESSVAIAGILAQCKCLRALISRSSNTY